MKESKKTYYRNWYQHWQQEKDEEEKIKAMKYFSEMQVEQDDSLDIEVYKPGYDRSLLNSNQMVSSNLNERQESFNERQQGVHREVVRKSNTSGDVVRGLLLGLPLLLVIATLLYATGIIPQETVNRLFGVGGNSPVIAYIEIHDEVMILHNEINQSLVNHIPENLVTSEFRAELQAKHTMVQEQTARLLEESNAVFANMNRLWTLKLASLDEMVNYILTNDEVTPEVLTYFNQFVSDQNDIGEQISLALSNLLSDNEIDYIQLSTGNIEIR